MTGEHFIDSVFIDLVSTICLPILVQVPASLIKLTGMTTEIKKRHENVGAC